MSQFIQVVDESNQEVIEIPSEDDGTLLLTTLSAQFPGACGLKYKSETGAYRGIRLADGVLYPPDGLWGNHHFIPVLSKNQKRKGEDGMDDNPSAKKRVNTKCSDLIVLGLPWKSTEEDLKKYFGQFGDLVLTQVKRDIRTGQSKGFGFIRFTESDAQVKCLSQRHMIDGRWCDVTLPNTREGQSNPMMNRKVFIGRCTENLTADDLRNYFSQFGEVVDVFIPKPFRAFAFVTFAEAEVAQTMCGEDHIINGTSVHISNAAPKSGMPDKSGMGRGGGGGGGGGGFGGFNQGGGFGSGMSFQQSAINYAAAALSESAYGTPIPGQGYMNMMPSVSNPAASSSSSSNAPSTGYDRAEQTYTCSPYQAGGGGAAGDFSNSQRSMGYGQQSQQSGFGSQTAGFGSQTAGFGSQTGFSSDQTTANPYASQAGQFGSTTGSQGGYGTSQQSGGGFGSSYSGQQTAAGYSQQQTAAGYGQQQTTAGYGQQTATGYGSQQDGYGSRSGYGYGY